MNSPLPLSYHCVRLKSESCRRQVSPAGCSNPSLQQRRQKDNGRDRRSHTKNAHGPHGVRRVEGHHILQSGWVVQQPGITDESCTGKLYACQHFHQLCMREHSLCIVFSWFHWCAEWIAKWSLIFQSVVAWATTRKWKRQGSSSCRLEDDLWSFITWSLISAGSGATGREIP